MYTEISLNLINHTIRHNRRVVVSWMVPVFQIYNSLLKLCGNRKDNVSVQIQHQKKPSGKENIPNQTWKQFTKKKRILEKRTRADHLEILKFQNLK